MFRRKEPKLDVMERNVLYAAAMIGRYHGRAKAIEVLDEVINQFMNESSPTAVTVDIIHMEETL